MIYPWQAATWADFSATWQRLASTWLIYGQKNSGKLTFARHCGQALLCTAPPDSSPFPCGQCETCSLLAAGNHPDFYLITPENYLERGGKKSDPIKIDAVRELTAKLQLSSYLGGNKVVIIYPAEFLNTAAQNALLKILEEPPEQTFFFLVSSRPDKLLPTVISRCRQTALPAAPTGAFPGGLDNRADGEEPVAAADNMPVPAAVILPPAAEQNFLELMCAPRLLKCLDFSLFYEREIKNPEHFLDWFYKWVSDFILIQSGWAARFYPDFSEQIKKMKYNQPIKKLFKLTDLVKEARRLQEHPLNARLQIEALLLEYLLLFSQ